MAGPEREYESIMILSVKIGEEKIKELIEKFKDFISKNAVLNSVDEWGKKVLCYPINYEKEGYYVLFDYKSSSDFSAELSRLYGITDGVMRNIIVCK